MKYVALLRGIGPSNPNMRNESSGESFNPTSRLNVTFLKKKRKSDPRFPYHAEKRGYTVVGMHGREVCCVVDLSGATTPDLMAWLEKQFGKEITTRTWKTVGKTVLNRLDSDGR